MKWKVESSLKENIDSCFVLTLNISPRHGLGKIGLGIAILMSAHRPQYCLGKEPDKSSVGGAAVVCCSALEWPLGSDLSPPPRAPPTSGGRSPPSAGCTARPESSHTILSAIPGDGATSNELKQ